MNYFRFLYGALYVGLPSCYGGLGRYEVAKNFINSYVSIHLFSLYVILDKLLLNCFIFNFIRFAPIPLKIIVALIFVVITIKINNLVEKKLSRNDVSLYIKKINKCKYKKSLSIIITTSSLLFAFALLILSILFSIHTNVSIFLFF